MIAVVDNQSKEIIIEVETEDAGWEFIRDCGAEGRWEVEFE